MYPKVYVQLAKLGDQLNLLPLLHKDAKNGSRCAMMVCKEYISQFEGCSYFDALPFDGPAHDLREAVSQAKNFGKPICTQVLGPSEIVEEFTYKPAGLKSAMTTSYQKEQWRVAGRLSDWDECLPLVIDRRNAQGEFLMQKHMPKGTKRPPVLVHADGISSPFPYKPLLLELLSHCGYPVIDLGGIKADRIYDLLALYEQAYALVAIDSAPLHLAWACPRLPVLALVNDRPLPWNGSAWRPNMEWYCRYHDFPDRAPEMMAVIQGMKPRATEFVHVWNAMLGKMEHLQERPIEAKWRMLPIQPGMCVRLGPPDNPQVPYLKTALKMAMQCVRGSQKVILTRPDTRFNGWPTKPRDIEILLNDNTACYAYRMTEKDGQRQFAPVVDFFCATVTWWKEHLGELPDVLFGTDYHWSHALWATFRKAGAADITGAVWREWTAPKTGAAVSPSTAFNQPLCLKHIADTRVSCRYPKVSEQVECEPLDRTALKPFGYNPTIIEDEGFLVMAYRFHPEATTATKVVLSQIDPSGAVVSNKVMDLDKATAEDPKLFMGSRGVWMSFVASMLPEALNSVVRYTELVNGKHLGIITPKLGKNDFSQMEKNWVFWWQDGFLYCLYQCSPVQQVHRLEGEEASQALETPGPKWAWGQPRGGTPPLEYEGAWLRFFHSALDNEWAGFPRRYFVGAYLMEKEPPFKVLRVSKRPIIFGSELDDLKVKQRPHHHKPNVVFPGGAVARPWGWTLAVGTNDSACLLAKITPKELNL